MLYQIHVITAGSQTSWSTAALSHIKKYDIKEQLNKFIAKHVAQILGQNFRYRLYQQF